MQKVLIFGTGKLYVEKESYIKNHFWIIGFLDNKVGDDSLTYENTKIPIYNPKNINQYVQQDVLIILMSYQYVSMWKQLYKLGVRKEKILFGIMFPPFTEKDNALFEHGRYLTVENDNVVYYLKSDKKLTIESHKQLQEIAMELLREKYRNEYPLINAIARMDARPASRNFGMERGKAIDRYYIENFLEENRELIYGDCLEIAENTYTLQYGEDKVKNSYILHLKGWGGR